MSTIRLLLSIITRHRALTWQFALRNLELRHKGSHLGLIWSILHPLVMLTLYVLVFGYIFGGSFGVRPGETRADYGLGIFLGLAIYNFISDVLGNAAGLISDNTNFVKKVVFPLEVLPAAFVISCFINLVITLGLVFLGLFLFGRWPGPGSLMLLGILLPVFMLALGIAWLISALGVFIKDIRNMLPALATGLMFASAVFYSTSRIPAPAWKVLRLNPLIHAINNARSVVLWDQSPDLNGLAYLYAMSLLAMLGGLWAFNRLRPAFADVM